MYQCRFTDYNKYNTLVGDLIVGAAVHVGILYFPFNVVTNLKLL